MDIGRPDRQQTYYRKVIRKDHDQISLDADMIRLLIAIDENKRGRGKMDFKEAAEALCARRFGRSPEIWF